VVELGYLGVRELGCPPSSVTAPSLSSTGTPRGLANPQSALISSTLSLNDFNDSDPHPVPKKNVTKEKQVAGQTAKREVLQVGRVAQHPCHVYVLQ